ncbi:MAG: phenylacetate--CoA ligase family protein [Selenomonadaceae bacterium]|nr:phenylacetate--CoA ligase family protein [Selenomonadaceae bacterium]
MQLERLKKIIGWAYEKSKFYQQSFDKAGVTPKDIQTLDDIKKFPFLTLSELNREDSMDFLTLPLSSIIRINYVEDSDAGINVTNFYTRDDIVKNVEMMIRCLQAAKIHRGSIVGVQGELSESRFLDVIYALESMGVTVVPLGNDYRRWIATLENFGMDMLISTPKLAVQLVIQLQAVGKNIADYPIRKIICLNTNNIQNPLQQHIEERTGAAVYNLFAPAEIGTAGLIFQCSNTSGHHVQEDNFFVEIVDFASDKIFEDEEHMGELVITTLTAQARPLIRYRTRQAVRRMSGSCICGRNFLRLATPFTK